MYKKKEYSDFCSSSFQTKSITHFNSVKGPFNDERWNSSSLTRQKVFFFKWISTLRISYPLLISLKLLRYYYFGGVAANTT